MASIYIIKSNSYRIVNKEIERIIKDLDSISYFSLNDVSIYDVIEDASYFGLFSNKRAIVVRDVKYFGGKFNYEEETEVLSNFFKNLSEDIILIFVVEQLNLKKKLTLAAISSGCEIIDRSSVDDNELDVLVKDYIQTNNITVDKDALKLLKANCLNNIDLIIQEIDKLSLISKIISKKIVEEAGSVFIDYKPNNDEDNNDKSVFEFSNAVIAKKFELSLQVLDNLLNKGIEVVQLVGLLASSFSTMYMIKAALQDNLSDEEIASLFGFTNPNRVYVLKNNVKIYTLDELKGIIISLSELDKKIKTGYNPVYEIKEFLLNL